MGEAAEMVRVTVNELLDAAERYAHAVRVVRSRRGTQVELRYFIERALWAKAQHLDEAEAEAALAELEHRHIGYVLEDVGAVEAVDADEEAASP